MDGLRFDRMTRALAGTSRRGLLKAGLGALLGGALTGLGPGGAGAQTRRAPGEICRTNGDCASGVCGPRDRTGRRYCQCVSASDCPQPSGGNPCVTGATCAGGVCGVAILVGATCDPHNLCVQNATCQADGNCLGTPVSCDDANACTVDSCDPTTGNCVYTLLDCDDGNPCTIDSCNSDSGCSYESVVCGDPDECHQAGTCNSSTGDCDYPEQPRGTPCSDGNALCYNGACCPTGYQQINGGCFEIDDDHHNCPSGCGGRVGNIDGSAHYLCGSYSGDFCFTTGTNADCPSGQVCTTSTHRCVEPC